MPQVHVNPTPEELRRFTEEMPRTRVSEFGNTNTHTKVLSRSAGSTYVVGATLMYHAVQNGDFYVGVQYMPLGSAEISGGGRQARLDLSGGIYLSAGINWPF